MNTCDYIILDVSLGRVKVTQKDLSQTDSCVMLSNSMQTSMSSTCDKLLRLLIMCC